MKTEQITIAVALIKNEADEILVAKRHAPSSPEIHGIWEFIGGGVEFSESPEEAIIREVKEESGLDVEVKRMLPKVFSEELKVENKVHLHVLVLTYECAVKGGQLKVGLDAQEEIEELKFLPINTVKQLKSFANVKKTIEWIETYNF